MPITVQHAKSVTIGDATTTAIVRPSDWNSVHIVTVDHDASEIASLFSGGSGISRTTAAGGITFGIDSGRFYEPYPMYSKATLFPLISIGTWWVDPAVIPFALNSGRINIFVSHDTGVGSQFAYGASSLGSVSTGSATNGVTLYNRLALYTMHSDGTHLVSVWSGTHDIVYGRTLEVSCSATSNSIRATFTDLMVYLGKIDESGNKTQSSISVLGTGSVAATSLATTKMSHTLSNYMTGPMMIPIPLNTLIPAGVYWVAQMHSTSSTTATANAAAYVGGTLVNASSISGLANPVYVSASWKRIGATISATTSQPYPGFGYYSIGNSLAPSTMALTDILIGTTYIKHVWHYVKDVWS